MKKILLFVLFVILLTFVSCENVGTTHQTTYGNETGLPAELKGLKVYDVSTGSGSYVKVAVLNNSVNSTTYKSGKHNKSTIIVYGNTTQEFKQEDIISENDSIIVLRK